MVRHRTQTWVALLLVAVTLAAYAPVVRNDLVYFDDPEYLLNNPIVRAGLTWQGIRWAFTESYVGNWHPVTWISHMLDCELFGLNPIGHHLMNVALHTANVGLLFAALCAMTGRPLPAALVALLFAVHPLQVESVGWAAQRKTVLSMLFGLIALGAYVRYVKSPRLRHYAAVVGALVLGLLAKPMLVTLPLVLLLLDYWPLGRFAQRTAGHSTHGEGRPLLGRPLVEKLPLLAIVAAFCLVTYAVQSRWGAVHALERLPFRWRLANAVASYSP